MQWMSIDDYAELTGLSVKAIDDLIQRDKLTTTTQNGEILIDPAKGASAIVPTELQELQPDGSEVVTPQFVEKTIGTIINLHERVLDAKDETIDSIKNENQFLKEALNSLQELYAEDRNTIETLTKQLKLSQDEVEFLRRKYKLMWGKVVEDYAKPA
ncbi:MAG: DUF3972 domain-containing protein [Campylobacterota bacterium]|nr:DUF3972 domain-containing protein [Campylobacterota bacterium]